MYNTSTLRFLHGEKKLTAYTINYHIQATTNVTSYLHYTSVSSDTVLECISENNMKGICQETNAIQYELQCFNNNYHIPATTIVTTYQYYTSVLSTIPYTIPIPILSINDHLHYVS